MIKVITGSEIMNPDTVVHVSVVSKRSLTEGKALAAAKDHLRGLGFRVSDLTFDPSTERSGMVSAYIA